MDDVEWFWFKRTIEEYATIHDEDGLKRAIDVLNEETFFKGYDEGLSDGEDG